MYKYSFIQVGISKLAASRWLILLIILLAACAPTTQETKVSEVDHDNTINGCLHDIAEQDTISRNVFINCVHNTNEQLTGPVRSGINDYLLSASNSELQKMASVAVGTNSSSYEESTKEEFARLLLAEIADILGSKQKRDY